MDLTLITPHYGRLGFADVDSILTIEERVYAHPWTRGNFTDSFSSGYEAFGFRGAEQDLFAYFVVMHILDELHLLNFAVDLPYQGQGYAKLLMDKLFTYAQEHASASILLEVRRSNVRAISVYEGAGFAAIGVRKGYYPAHDNQREDAIVMRRIC
ncbi:ribosomal protein S18-alanine N-acetyltransferase [Undibacterium pigrum]|uniref:[Ribosomal protein bS18]-alanine N-acetyltransferase n=1 Tax=Undibacterium pigrum TaxID=401470 RepID=A0A318JAC9_9BURK|nr:ribosomal protein S18-alanine N-acetyltransferase [Undibacterium pigrum]PXX46458.1 [SSU ribosomal protein S18P]-alanine acetyltransferase [Undibacterium pigrum]